MITPAVLQRFWFVDGKGIQPEKARTSHFETINQSIKICNVPYVG